MNGMVDVHCHLLPGVDDGPETWEETLLMCQRAAADGITHIVATPHCNDSCRYDREAYQANLDDLASRFPALGFTLGCDFHFSYDNIKDLKRRPECYTIGTTHYLLAELSEFGIPQTLSSVFFDLISSGMTPIITHPERNQLIQRRLDLLNEWSSLGCLIQITANSLTGGWGSKVKKISVKLLKQGLVHVIASDAHNASSRPPVLSEARRAVVKLVGEEAAASLFFDVPAAIVRGERLD
jgi:protein-tyrosine phosphatase